MPSYLSIISEQKNHFYYRKTEISPQIIDHAFLVGGIMQTIF